MALHLQNGEYLQALKCLKDQKTRTMEDLNLMGEAEYNLHNYEAAYGYYLMAKNTKEAVKVRAMVPISELEKEYGEFIYKCRILRVNGRRGVFATEDIRMGDIILKIPLDKCYTGTKKELSGFLLKDTVYSRSMPKEEFPVEWSESLRDQISVTPLRVALEQKIKIYDEEGIDYNSRALVGSRNFISDKTYLVPFGDMLNHGKSNIDWRFTGTHFIMSATEKIKEHAECFDSYGPKSNYETFLHYGFVQPDNRELDVVRVIATLPAKVYKDRIDPRYFSRDFEFEIMGQYKEGTVEIFSFLRYMRSNAPKCPETLRNYLHKPVSIENELWVCKMLFNILQKDVKRRVEKSAYGIEEPLAVSLLQAEMNVLVYWGETLMEAIQILDKKDKKLAKKSKKDYIVRVIKKLL
jgi:hypothetical protein